MADKLRVLHAIHDFLPRHRAGFEIYANELCRHLQHKHHITVLCAEFDPAREHASVTWRDFDGLSVAEVVNNWHFDSFADTYQSSRLNLTLQHVLRATGPDVLHIHSLLNLSFDLPALARQLGIPSVATLHDYTLVCPSGGQRVHLAEEHVCEQIEPERCSRCFPQSPVFQHMAFSKVARRAAVGKPLLNAARWMLRHAPGVVTSAASAVATAGSMAVTPRDINARLDKAKSVFDEVELFVAPSPALGAEYVRLGLPASKIHVSDYGFPPLTAAPPRPMSGPLRIGFVGTLVWHKGPHIVIDAVKRLPAGAYELKMFGDPGVFPQYANDLQQQALGLPIRFMGSFRSADAAAVYAQFDVLVVSSLWPENSPLVIHEAFMAGVPVVGARQGGIPDLVTHESNGLLYDAYSAPALAAALQRLLDDRTLVERFSAKLPRVKSIDEDVAEWDDVYRSVVNRRRPSSLPLA